MDKRLFQLVLAILVVQSLLYAVLSFMNFEATKEWSIITSTWSTLVALGATVAFLVLGYLYDWRSEQGRNWVVFGVGMLLWAGGELVWLMYVIVEDSAPYPSFADVSWILGYPFLAVGLFLLERQLGLDIPRVWNIVHGAVVVVVSVIILLVLGPPLIEGVELVEATFSLAYPVGDMVLLYFASRIFLKFKDAEVKWPWFLIAAAFVMNIFADILFTFQSSLFGTFDLGPFSLTIPEYGLLAYEFCDALFIVGYALAIAGALTYYYLLSEALSD